MRGKESCGVGVLIFVARRAFSKNLELVYRVNQAIITLFKHGWRRLPQFYFLCMLCAGNVNMLKVCAGVEVYEKAVPKGQRSEALQLNVGNLSRNGAVQLYVVRGCFQTRFKVVPPTVSDWGWVVLRYQAHSFYDEDKAVNP